MRLLWASKILQSAVIRNEAEKQVQLMETQPERRNELTPDAPWWEAVKVPSDRLEMTPDNLTTLLTQLDIPRQDLKEAELKAWLELSFKEALKQCYIVETMSAFDKVAILGGEDANKTVTIPTCCPLFANLFGNETTFDEPRARLTLITMPSEPESNDALTRVTRAHHESWAQLQSTL